MYAYFRSLHFNHKKSIEYISELRGLNLKSKDVTTFKVYKYFRDKENHESSLIKLKDLCSNKFADIKFEIYKFHEQNDDYNKAIKKTNDLWTIQKTRKRQILSKSLIKFTFDLYKEMRLSKKSHKESILLIYKILQKMPYINY